MVYRQIHEGIPVIYGGSDSDYSGHEFVLDGYDEEGAVHINWGWNGAEDGYFDLQTLTLYSFYDFSYYQDMLIRCTPHRLSTETVDVDVQVPGTLHRLLSEEQLSKTMSLRVSGRINSTDLKTLRGMAGRSNAGTGTWGQLSLLDLSEARLVAGGEPYLIEDTMEYRIEDDDVMPYKAFAGCALLIDVTLPRCLRGFGDGVFANCHNLDHVAITAGEESDFVVEGSFVLNRDRSELIACLPGNGCDTEYAVPDGVRVIHDYAFAGLFLYDRLVLPATVEKIGRYAFNRCFDLMRTYVYATEPPEIDPTAIDDLDLSLRSLYVPAQSKRHYQKAPGWKKYKSSVWSIDDNGIVATPTHEYPAVSTVYDLWGRMMDKRPLPPGIYLRSGKKYIVR